jgi:hypothetical protein
MRPHCASFYAYQKKFGGRTGKAVRVPIAAQIDIVIWRAFLCLLRFDEKSYARSIFSFKPAPPTYLIEYDASLDGFGVLLSTQDPTTGDTVLIAHAAMTVPFLGGSRDSSYQNACEYTAVLLALLILRQTRQPKGFYFDLIGDSVSSLAWIERDIVNSSIAQGAHIAYTLLAVRMDAMVSKTTFIPSKQNAVCDALSRGVSGMTLGLPTEREFRIHPSDAIHRYVCRCDPRLQFTSAQELVAQAQELLEILEEI